MKSRICCTSNLKSDGDWQLVRDRPVARLSIELKSNWSAYDAGSRYESSTLTSGRSLSFNRTGSSPH